MTHLLPDEALLEGDALAVARLLPEASVDLVYLDPPFFTGRTHRSGDRSFCDTWGDLDNYLTWLAPILAESRRCLSPTGSMYVHLDWHACHYVKVELDRLFGRDCFLNHIAWLYGLGGSSPRYWPRKHDDLLWYSREPDGHYFDPVMVPARSQRMRGQDKKMPDYWNIPTLNNMASERIGYPTQKPEALLELIVASSCPPGGRVADFFVGSGTSCAVARRLGRRFLGSDLSPQAVAMSCERLGLNVTNGALLLQRKAPVSAEDET
ncbi:MAG: site-specific DNA-methyltransferase [Cyanobacteria bacterium REEB65]|nr:site-specific DNA-methyltransferase [Cyanobacteria bacterium REEB65]